MKRSRDETKAKASETKHTPGPLDASRVSGSPYTAIVEGDRWIGEMSRRVDASRVVSTWNACEGIPDPERAIPAMREALRALVGIIDAAGLEQLSRGVELGATSWYVKATERMDYAREALRLAGEES